MQAIVTGSNGFIGYNLCKALNARGWDVTGIDDLSSGLPENTVPGLRYEQVKVQEKERMAEILSAVRPAVIFHLAAIPRVSYSVQNPFITAEANVLGTLSLLEGIVRAGLKAETRLVFSSSSSVYGGADILPTPESYPHAPKSPYALQKSQGEQWLQLFAELYGVDCVSLRYFNVFGPHALFGGAYSTVLSAWMYHLYVDRDYEPFLEGDGTQSRDFCFVDNVVQALILAATREKRFRGEAFNVAQGKAHSLLQCKDLLEKISGEKLVLAQKPPRVGDVKHTRADISAAREQLGYDPQTDFEAQLRTMASWYANSYPASARK
jgi:nucleoside-diphosphate-sugar epimerase